MKTNSGVLHSDLVVEAAGGASRCGHWLEKLGYENPREDRIEIGLHCTTRLFRRRPYHLDGDVAATVAPTAEGKRGGVMLAQEGDRWIVTLISHFSNPAPAELDGFIEFSRTLPAPYIYNAIRYAEPVGEPATSRFPASVWRRYDKLNRFPKGYVVFGDAISSFNPRYGQGTSVVALQAIDLQKTLSECPSNLARPFFARAAKTIEVPWAVAATNDLSIRNAKGPRRARARLMNRYLRWLLKAAHHDPYVAIKFHLVTNLMAVPKSLLEVRVMSRVLRASLPRSKWSFGQPTFSVRCRQSP